MISVRLPFDSGGSPVAVTQEPGGETSHAGALYNSWDFSLQFGAQVLAIADGVVVDTRDTVPDGGASALPNDDEDSNPANDDPSLGSGAIGNLVTIRHVVDGKEFYATYMHLKQASVLVEVDQIVVAGDVIGLVGNTGARTGTHLHFQVGSESTPFGSTNYGGAAPDVDGTVTEIIANATESEVGLVSFLGYGTDLPSSVVGPSANVSAISP